MRLLLLLLTLLALASLLGGCTMVDVRWAPSGGVHSDAFVSGYVDSGWPASDSLLQLGLFDGPSRGALLYFQVWKLFRFELGFIGAALGVGPLDTGVGILLYDPQPPAYTDHEHGDDDDGCHEACCEDEGESDSAADAADNEHPFIYDAY